MLDFLYFRYKEKFKGIYRKIFLITIFSWNLVIYSIPLALLSYRFIIIPKEILTKFTEFISMFLCIGYKKVENTLIIKDYYFIIDQDCIGYKSILGFFAIIFATPINDYREKMRYFLIFSPILFFLNIVRILSTIYLFYFFNIDPYIIHDVLWGFLTTFMIIFFWYKFYKKFKEKLK